MQEVQKQIRNLIHSPNRGHSELVAYAKECRDTPGITWGVPAIDEKIVPARPGRMTSIIGRPGGAKSSLLIYLARREAQRIFEHRTHEKECVVFVTWEQTVAELEAMIMADEDIKLDDISWGRADVGKLIERGRDRIKLPVWIVGMGMQGAGVDQIDMTPDVVFRAIELMQRDWGLRPTLICFDYLQLIPIDKRDRMGKSEWGAVKVAINETKALALKIGVPIYNAVQGGREVDSHKDKMPRLNDGQMSSAIEQSSDCVLGITRPIMFQEEIGQEFVQDKTGHRFEINDNLLVMRMLKQRGASPVGKWFLYFNPATFRLGLAQPEGR